ncbi:hypothetical protein PGT21_007912 [Puccinia graminis f. sp. tritici]|uniref:Uncharacterized protein n=1 Tax=Puccinia graminis f. sp. tritici TaxID=56615 RepID=A0A5B0R1S0_PUCGR|nr:hypothetical protein PGT21_007912 [Puccinia graminis f. sp. tritici]
MNKLVLRFNNLIETQNAQLGAGKRNAFRHPQQDEACSQGGNTMIDNRTRMVWRSTTQPKLPPAACTSKHRTNHAESALVSTDRKSRPGQLKAGKVHHLG